MKSIVVIPARLKSTRLPNKLLLKINGKTMIRLTVEKIMAGGIESVVVATDSDLILKECSTIPGVIGVATSPDHVCGTDRVLEAYNIFSREQGKFDIVVNVQGDEPFIDPELFRELATELEKRSSSSYWTTVTKIDPSELDDENVAKVVLDLRQNALIFTRKTIDKAYKHTSIYVYRPDFLRKFCALPPSPLEEAYRLEQMRALDNGFKLNCIPLKYDAISINTIEDLSKAGIENYEILPD